MTAFATHGDVTDRWIGDNVPANALIDVWLDDASDLIRSEFPDIDDRIASTSDTAGHVPGDRVKRITVSVVTRVLRNPDNLKSRGAGPFTAEAAAEQPGEFRLTERERAELAGAPESGSRQAFTIDPTPQADPGWIGAPDGIASDWSGVW